MFDITKNASIKADTLRYNRTSYSILASAMSELGELAQEVAVMNGHSYKTHGPDGIAGETVDVIVSLLDLIHICCPTMTEDRLADLVQSKCNKWISKIEERNNG